jgi:hypothetical protein
LYVQDLLAVARNVFVMPKPLVHSHIARAHDQNRSSLPRRNAKQARSNGLLLLVLNAPVMAEVVRKYFIQQELIAFLPEALVLIVGSIVMANGTGMPKRLPVTFWICAVLYLAWGVVGEMRSNNPLQIYAIGLGTAVLPFFYLSVSAAYYRENGAAAVNGLFWSASLWIIVFGVVAIAQIISGQDGWFSQYGLGQIGNGDYSVDGRVVDGLFRPTSVFLHTGKFGQTLFALMLFKLCVLFHRQSRPSVIVITLALWDVAVVVISGQRSAFLFLTASLLVLGLFSKGRGRLKLITGVGAGLAVASLVAVLLGVFRGDIVDIIRDRYLSAYTDVPGRVSGGVIKPIGAILNRYPIFGEGVGFFSISAVRYGAKVIYEYLGEGGAENSWIRTIGEIGFVGFCYFFLIMAQIALTGLSAMVRAASSDQRAIGAFLFLWLLSCMLWANTHDVFGNLISMCVGFGLAGYAVLENLESPAQATEITVSAVAKRFDNLLI